MDKFIFGRGRWGAVLALTMAQSCGPPARNPHCPRHDISITFPEDGDVLSTGLVQLRGTEAGAFNEGYTWAVDGMEVCFVGSSEVNECETSLSPGDHILELAGM